MLDVLREQYITAGRAKGLGERAGVYKHASASDDPHVTIIGISFATHLRGGGGGDGLQHPGSGRLIISAVLRRDYHVIQGVVSAWRACTC